MRRRVLLRSLLLRELGVSWVAAIAVVVTAAVWTASVAASLSGDVAPNPITRMIRRFDLALLGVVAVIAALRIAQRVADDFRAGWTEPWFAAGGSHPAYGIALVVAVLSATGAWFVAGAIAFAAAVAVFDSTTELVTALPRLVPAGLLLICCVTLYSGAVAFVVRESLTSIMFATLFALVPFIVTFTIASRNDGAVPTLIWLWNISYPPPLTLAHSGVSLLRQCIYAVTGSVVIALLAHRYAGRRT